MSSDKIQPVVLATGLIVVGGLFAFSMRKRSRCRKLTGIYKEEGPIHLTIEAQAIAYEAARIQIREHLTAGAKAGPDAVALVVADALRDCSWENLKTDEQKAVWEGIKDIVADVGNAAAADPEGFKKSF